MQSSETGQGGAAVPQSSSAFGDGAFVQPGGDSESLPLPLCFFKRRWPETRPHPPPSQVQRGLHNSSAARRFGTGKLGVERYGGVLRRADRLGLGQCGQMRGSACVDVRGSGPIRNPPRAPQEMGRRLDDGARIQNEKIEKTQLPTHARPGSDSVQRQTGRRGGA